MARGLGPDVGVVQWQHGYPGDWGGKERAKGSRKSTAPALEGPCASHWPSAQTYGPTLQRQTGAWHRAPLWLRYSATRRGATTLVGAGWTVMRRLHRMDSSWVYMMGRPRWRDGAAQPQAAVVALRSSGGPSLPWPAPSACPSWF